MIRRKIVFSVILSFDWLHFLSARIESLHDTNFTYEQLSYLEEKIYNEKFGSGPRSCSNNNSSARA